MVQVQSFLQLKMATVCLEIQNGEDPPFHVCNFSSHNENLEFDGGGGGKYS